MATTPTSVDELTLRVEDLKRKGDYHTARQEIEDFIHEHPDEADEHGLTELLASLITEMSDGEEEDQEQDWETRLRSARVYSETGDKNTALGILKNMLQERADNQAVLDELVSLAESFPDYREDVARFLRSMPENPAIEATLASLERKPAPPEPQKEAASAQPASTSAPDDLAQAMRLYRTRHHQDAMEIFDRIIRDEPEESTVWREAYEYRQKAEDAFLRGEVPLEELPEDALVSASKARSFVRLGDYEQAEQLYATAINLCRQAGMQVPGEWDRQREEAEVYAGARRLEKEGDEFLRDDEWDQALERWMQAHQAMDEQDPRLKDKVESLRAVRESLVRADVATSLGPGDIEAQANELAKAIISLRDAAIKFPNSRRIAEVRDRVVQSASAVVDSVRERGSESRERAEASRSLQSKLNWVEQAEKWFDLAARLSPGQSALGLEAMSARDAGRLYEGLSEDLQQAGKLINAGDEEGLQEAQQLLDRVQGTCPSDPELKVQVRQLERRYVDLAEQYLETGSLDSSQEIIGVLQGDLFQPLSPGARLVVGRVEGTVARANLINKVRAAGIGAGIIIGVIIIIAALYRPVFLPMFSPAPTATPTATATATATPSPTLTMTPTASPTPTNTPTVTPSPTEAPSPTPTATPILAFSRVQAYTYPLPCGQGGHSGFVVQLQRVGVIREEVCADGERWLYITWTIGDAEQYGWIQADRIGF